MKTFEELNTAYPDVRNHLDRYALSKARRRQYVEDLFDVYEHTGFADTFVSDTADHDDIAFEVLCRCNESDVILSQLPAWKIRFSNGYEMVAYPEEICLAER